MQVVQYATDEFHVFLSVEDRSLLQNEADSRPYFQVVDVASVIAYLLHAELKVLKERYDK